MVHSVQALAQDVQTVPGFRAESVQTLADLTGLLVRHACLLSRADDDTSSFAAVKEQSSCPLELAEIKPAVPASCRNSNVPRRTTTQILRRAVPSAAERPTGTC